MLKDQECNWGDQETASCFASAGSSVTKMMPLLYSCFSLPALYWPVTILRMPYTAVIDNSFASMKFAHSYFSLKNKFSVMSFRYFKDYCRNFS